MRCRQDNGREEKSLATELNTRKGESRFYYCIDISVICSLLVSILVHSFPFFDFCLFPFSWKKDGKHSRHWRRNKWRKKSNLSFFLASPLSLSKPTEAKKKKTTWTWSGCSVIRSGAYSSALCTQQLRKEETGHNNQRKKRQCHAAISKYTYNISQFGERAGEYLVQSKPLMISRLTDRRTRLYLLKRQTRDPTRWVMYRE